MSSPLHRWSPGGPTILSLDQVPGLETSAGVLLMLLVVPLLCSSMLFCIVRMTCSMDPGMLHLLPSLLGSGAGGVFLATCLLDLLPSFLQGFSQAFSQAGITLQFPLPEFVLALGFFLVLVLEQLVLAFREQWQCVQEERRGLLLDSEGYARATGSFAALRVFVLVFSLSLHSVLGGLALGLLEAGREVRDVPEVLRRCRILALQRSLVALGLSVQLWQRRLRRSAATGCLLLFAAAWPLGTALGLGLGPGPSQAETRLQMLRCSLEGLAVGTFSYITFMDVLPQQLAVARHRIPRLVALLGGFTAVTAALFITL